MRYKYFKFIRNENLFIVLLAIGVGVLSGVGAVGVRFLIRLFQRLFFGGNGIALLEPLRHLPWWYILIAPAIGGLIIGPIIYYFAREAKGHGVPEVMLATLLQGGKIRPRVAFIKALVSALCIGSGGSVGREGPLVQIGASVGSTLGQLFKLTEKQVSTLVACGAGSGIAAAFNAPIAGALFAVEIILGDFGVSAFSPIVISSVMATLVSHFFEGDFAAFVVPPYKLVSAFELIPYTILGIVAGFVALGFIWVLYFSENAFEKWAFPEWLKPALGGLVIGGMALGIPNLFGVGYETINEALHGSMALWFLLLLIPAKILATSITLGSGGSGGVFAPSLFLGASTGGIIGILFHAQFPHLTANPGAYALVGMGAVVAAATQAPITAILIIFELTNNYHIIVPLMFSCIISTLITTNIKKESIYTQKLKFKGINLKEGREESILKAIPVAHVMTSPVTYFTYTVNLDTICDVALKSPQHVFPVVDEQMNYRGYFSMGALKSVLFDKGDLANLVIAEDIIEGTESVSLEANVHEAMDMLGNNGMEELPVVDGEKLAGLVAAKQILEIYQMELHKRELAMAVVSKKKFNDLTEGFYVGGGYRLDELPILDKLVGKTLKETNFRADYGLEIVMIHSRKHKKEILPRPEYRFQKGDMVVVVGTLENILKYQEEEELTGHGFQVTSA